MRAILRKFVADRGGNYAMMTVIMMLPLMGALTIGIDYAEMSRQKQLALNALDAAGLGTARRYLSGDLTEAQLKTYAEDFFKANYGGQDASRVTLTLVLPTEEPGGQTLTLSAAMTYKPHFLPVMRALLGNSNSGSDVDFNESTQVRLKNTLEVAMALDNSGSMLEKGGSSGQVRMDLLKTAAKQLVETLAAQGSAMRQVDRAVQFSLVPFAGSVNVGPGNKNETWMDVDGIAPAHHENFDWTRMEAANSNKKIELVSGIYRKIGSGWPVAERNAKVTRITLFDDMKRITYTTGSSGTEYVCTREWGNGTCREGYWRTPVIGPFTSWKGCVEARPSPFNSNDAAATVSTPATLFQPMFAPDETDRKDVYDRDAYNSWWGDVASDTGTGADLKRQKYTPKYFQPFASEADNSLGPNQSCTTKAITPLTDVTVAAGLNSIKAAIDDMQPNGATNVPEGMAWGWRTLSSTPPFTQGRPEAERGNDKVVIVVTDGANTYYTPGSLGANDLAGNKSIYSAYAYASTKRIFNGTSIGVDYENDTYGDALNEQFKTLCTNAKAGRIMVMTVALDLDASKTVEKKQIDLMKECASDSRYRKNADGTPAKQFWNSTGASLANDFKEIGNELSNLRIVG